MQFLLPTNVHPEFKNGEPPISRGGGASETPVGFEPRVFRPLSSSKLSCSLASISQENDGIIQFFIKKIHRTVICMLYYLSNVDNFGSLISDTPTVL